MSDTGTGTAAGRDRGLNRDTGKRIMVAFGFLMELVMIAVGLWPAVWLVSTTHRGSMAPWDG